MNGAPSSWLYVVGEICETVGGGLTGDERSGSEHNGDEGIDGQDQSD
jgi:hypothetical protein